MPLLKRRHDHTKVYRPNGTKYADGSGTAAEDAVFNAQWAFQGEFGYVPKPEHTIIEVLGVTAGFEARFMEIEG
jgi:hypothetical protein